MDIIKYFGVTDHHIIIPLKEVGRIGMEEFTKIETVIDGTPDSYMECHHRIYFKEMWLGEDGLPDKGNVFVNEEDAVAYALKKAKEKIKMKTEALNAIKRQVVKLKADS